MSQDQSNKPTRSKFLLYCSCIFVAAALVGTLVYCFGTRAHFTLGHTLSFFRAQSVSKMSGSANFNPKATIINIGWNDPGGQITRGRSCGLRIGSRAFTLDMYYAPTGFKGALSNF